MATRAPLATPLSRARQGRHHAGPLAITLKPDNDCPQLAREWYRDRTGLGVVADCLHEVLSALLGYRLSYAVCVDGVWQPFDVPLLGECRLGRTLIVRKEVDMRDNIDNQTASAPVQETIADLLKLFDLSEERDGDAIAEFARRLNGRFLPVHQALDVIDEHFANAIEQRLAALERLNQSLQTEIRRHAKGRPLSASAKEKSDILTHA